MVNKGGQLTITYPHFHWHWNWLTQATDHSTDYRADYSADPPRLVKDRQTTKGSLKNRQTIRGSLKDRHITKESLESHTRFDDRRSAKINHPPNPVGLLDQETNIKHVY